MEIDKWRHTALAVLGITSSVLLLFMIKNLIVWRRNLKEQAVSYLSQCDFAASLGEISAELNKWAHASEEKMRKRRAEKYGSEE